MTKKIIILIVLLFALFESKARITFTDTYEDRPVLLTNGGLIAGRCSFTGVSSRGDRYMLSFQNNRWELNIQTGGNWTLVHYNTNLSIPYPPNLQYEGIKGGGWITNPVFLTDKLMTLAGDVQDELYPGSRPTVTSVTSSTKNGKYKKDDEISIQVNFSKAVTVTGIPQLELATGLINYSGVGSGTSSLSFTYKVNTGDKHSDLDYASTNALLLNSGTIKSTEGSIAKLALSTPGATGSLGANADLEIDTQAPLLAITSNVSKLKIGQTATITFTFSEDPGTTFIPANVTANGGKLSIFSGLGLIRTATFTLTTDVGSGVANIIVPSGVYTDEVGNSGTAAALNFEVDNIAPSTMAGPKVTATSGQNVLNWVRNSTAVYYKIYGGSTSSTVNSLFQTITDPTLSYIHTGLTNGSTYYYAISAVDEVGNESVKSLTTSGTPKAAQTITFKAPVPQVYGSSFTVNASSSSLLSVVFTSDNSAVATVFENTVTIVGIGAVNITASQSGNSAFEAAAPVSFPLQILTKPITVTAISNSKIYGSAEPAEFGYTISPALIGDDLATGALVRADGADVNTYEISIGTFALDASKYFVTYIPADFSINVAPLIVTADPKSKVYGAAVPALTASYAGFVNGDTPANLTTQPVFTTTAMAGSTVTGSPYAITASAATSANYTITYVSGGLTVDPKALTITGDPKSKIYGAEVPALTASYAGFVNGDTPASLTTQPVLTTTATAGSTVTGSPYAITASAATSANYIIIYVSGGLTVDQTPLTITAVDKEKFAGTTNPTFTAAYSGFVNGDNSAVLTRPVSFNTTADDRSTVGSYDIMPSGAMADNYQINYVKGILTVKPGAPTSVALVATTLYENRPAGTNAGTFNSTSDDPDASFTYTLVSGSGDTDNVLFSIIDHKINTTEVLDFENKSVYRIRVRATTKYGLWLEKELSVSIANVNEIPTLAVISNQNICYTTTTQAIALTGVSAGPESTQNISISVSGDNEALFQTITASGSGSTGTISYRVKDGVFGTSIITVTVKDNGGTANGGLDTYSRTFSITVNDLPVVSVNADKGTAIGANSVELSKGERVILTASGGASYAWAKHSSIITGGNNASIEVRPRETTTYTVMGSNASGCTESMNFTIKVLDDLVKVKATNILTPNGDGYNDLWVIDNIDFYEQNEVRIFDKAGRLLYSKKGYDNSWDGMLNGSPLAEGTYYYVLDFGKDRRIFKGFITIVREN